MDPLGAKTTIGVQHQIRHNAEEISSYMNDLFDWADEITDKDLTLASAATGAKHFVEPESDEEDDAKENGGPTANALKPRATVAPRTHKEWDKFKVDDELNKIEEKDRSEAEKAQRKKVVERRYALNTQWQSQARQASGAAGGRNSSSCQRRTRRRGTPSS